ncbi:MAG: hypothetical protein EZS28_038679 [Streblomastix strix]|uniref:Uncharacterized protein n=1 Tax=Streblomastix strix TaxID=222440 RepID=A0A5J4U5E2_9EUKA|nr:MAG: hypothetical protein EZS28_038679 [Streblomastix strix]
MAQQAGNTEALHIQRLERVLVRRRLFIGINQHITLSVKGTQVSKPSRQIKKKRVNQNIQNGEGICDKE